jgi:N-acetylglutamate synthase-like GNAT family acetyltransferase
MSGIPIQVRRATVEDLPRLRGLWQAEQFPASELERRFTEFQVVLGPGGELLGAVGLHIQNQHGLLHSEAFVHPETEEELRPLLWERIQAIARNHGLLRLWTRERAPFWRRCGLEPAGEAELQRLPPAFGERQREWLTLRLRDELAVPHAIEREFELFKAEQDAAMERTRRQVRIVKAFAWAIGLILLAVAAVILVKFVKLAPLHWPR